MMMLAAEVRGLDESAVIAWLQGEVLGLQRCPSPDAPRSAARKVAVQVMAMVS